MHTKLDHCVIHVSDWERSNAFYRDVLGAQLIDRGAGTWAYRFGTEQLNVHGPGAEPDPVARIPVAPGNSDLCFEWPGPIEKASTHLREHGIEIEQGPVSRHRCCRRLWPTVGRSYAGLGCRGQVRLRRSTRFSINPAVCCNVT